MVHIGKAIAWGRSSIGLTKAEFAKQIDCDRSWVFRLENGTSCPSHDFVEHAARMFGLPNVERMKLGFLPDRLAVITAAQLKAVGRSLKKFPNWEQEFELAKSGVRQPSDEVLQILAKHLTAGSVEALLYGELASAEKVESP